MLIGVFLRIVSAKTFIEIIVIYSRAVARSKNPGGLVVLGGDNVPPLVEIGLTDPPKSGGAAAPPLPPTLLHACKCHLIIIFGTYLVL